MKYKVLSLMEPWASMIALGKKKIETRSWYTAYRGSLAIHVAKTEKGLDNIKSALAFSPLSSTPFTSLVLMQLRIAGYKSLKDLSFGKIILTCELFDCQKIHAGMVALLKEVNMDEYLLGNYDYESETRFAWMLRNVKVLEHPIAVSGKQGLWDYEGELK